MLAPVAPIAGAVLAAGAGRRMGGPKATIESGGERLLDSAVDALFAAGCDPVLAVVRPGTTPRLGQAVVNADPSRGMRSSLELAVDAAEKAGPVGALAVVLVDVPDLLPDAIRLVMSSWRPGRIAVGTHGAQIGHPIVMSPLLWRAAVGQAGPDEGARAFLRARSDLVDRIAIPGDGTDLDTPADLERWRISTGRQ